MGVFDGEPPFLMVQSCSITTATMWGPQTIAKLVNISPISIYFNMVYDTVIYFWHLLTIYGSINQRYPKVTSQKGAQWNPFLPSFRPASHAGSASPFAMRWRRRTFPVVKFRWTPCDSESKLTSKSYLPQRPKMLDDAGVEALEYPCPQKRISVLNRKGNLTTQKKM